MHQKITPIILCGGGGTRLLPFLKSSVPKQFLNLIDEKYNLLQTTLKRFQNTKFFNKPILVTASEHRDFIMKSIRKIGCPIESIIFEAIAKNTGPAIALAMAYMMYCKADNMPVVIVPIDHYIKDQEIFVEGLMKGSQQVLENEKPLTFSVFPTSIELNYGYLKVMKHKQDIYNVENFVEKPSINTIKEQFQNSFMWNSGIYCMTPQIAKNIIVTNQPKVWSNSKTAFIKSAKYSSGFSVIVPSVKHFSKNPSISFDNIITNPYRANTLMSMDIGTLWEDVGSISSVKRLQQKKISFATEVLSKKEHVCINTRLFKENVL